MPSLTVTEILSKVNDKLAEAADFLGEMEQTQEDYRSFRHRLSAFLSAAGSVPEVMEAQGKIYSNALDKGSQTQNRATFTKVHYWYEQEENQFRTPWRSTSKNPKPEGTNTVWVYLRQARHSTIHLEPANPSDKIAALTIGILVKVRDQSEPEPPPGAALVQKQKKLWKFTELEVYNHDYTQIVKRLPPPSGSLDVVTICTNHMQTLKDLIVRYEKTLISL